MILRAFAICSLFLAFSPLALSQEPEPTPRERVRRTFSAADLNGDDHLDAREISRASIPASATKTWDHDRDGKLSRDEFLLYYRQLMVNAGQDPGRELNAEAKRIEEARRAKKAREAKLEAREKELAKLQKKSEKDETVAEKYERAQAALAKRTGRAGEDSRAAQSSRGSLSERARQALGSGGGAADDEVTAETAKRLNRAEEALGGKSTGESPKVEPSELGRALAALEERANKGGWTREQYETAHRELVDRALDQEGDAGSGRGLGNQAGTNRADLARALLALEERVKKGGWTREKYAEEREKLIQRAKDERAGTSGQQGGAGQGAGAGGGAVTPEQRDLDRALAALDKRAKDGGWSREKHEAERQKLIQRAKDERAGTSGQQGGAGQGAGAGGGAVTPEQRDLDRALAALDKRAKDGGWSREKHEAERQKLIQRAKDERAGTSGQPGGAGPGAGTGGGAVTPEQRDLDRALAALDKRAKDGGWSREKHEAERQKLIQRAKDERAGTSGQQGGAGQGAGAGGGAVTPEQRDLDRALAALDKRAKDGGWSREKHEAERQKLIQRAKDERAGTSGQPGGAGPGAGTGGGAVTPEQRDLDRALAALDKRAKDGGWSREKHEAERQKLIQRAKDERAGTSGQQGGAGQGAGAGGGAVTPEQRDLDRALAALDKRAKDGGWSREKHEAERQKLIQRAKKERAGTSGKQEGGNPSRELDARGQKAVKQAGRVKAAGGGQKPPPEDRAGKGGAEREAQKRDGQKKDAQKKDAQKKDAQKKDAGNRDAGKQGTGDRKDQKKSGGDAQKLDVSKQKGNKQKTDQQKAAKGARGGGGTRPPERKDGSSGDPRRGG